jgi:hypothetical protein
MYYKFKNKEILPVGQFSLKNIIHHFFLSVGHHNFVFFIYRTRAVSTGQFFFKFFCVSQINSQNYGVPHTKI